MKHLSEEQLVMIYYGEEDGRHLAGCEQCSAEYRRIEAALAHADAFTSPARGEGYGREVWARVAPRLGEREPHGQWWRAWLAPQRWAVAGAAAALVVAAFFAGRFWPYQGAAPAQPAGKAIAREARERILMVAVGDHLERSQMVLLELVNAERGAEVDLSSEQARAEDLVAANRLYRQTAARSGDTAIANLLDELERSLLEIARSPSRLSSDEFEDLRRRIEAQGIVFKVRVIDSKLRQQTAGGNPTL